VVVVVLPLLRPLRLLRLVNLHELHAKPGVGVNRIAVSDKPLTRTDVVGPTATPQNPCTYVSNPGLVKVRKTFPPGSG